MVQQSYYYQISSELVPYYNVTLGVLTVLYIKLVSTLLDSIRQNHPKWLTLLQSRKIVHMSAASTCFLIWPLYEDSHWTFRSNSLAGFVFALVFFVKGLIVRDPNDTDVRTMSRTGNPMELLVGPLLYALTFIYVGVFQFKTELGIYIMAAMGFGDGIAPIVGTLYPWGRYSSWGTTETKTLSGSFAMFLGTIVSVYVIRAVLGTPANLLPERVLGIAFIASVVEAVSGIWDNLAVVTSVVLFYRLSSV